jgi:hypothetical protein
LGSAGELAGVRRQPGERHSGGGLAAAGRAGLLLPFPLNVAAWGFSAASRTVVKGMHAKLAIADSEVLLVSSANLTKSGIGKTIEAGPARPRRACSGPGRRACPATAGIGGHSNACTRVAPLFEPDLARARRGTR